MDKHSTLICQLCDVSGHCAPYCPKLWHINPSTNDEDLEEECDEENDLTGSSWYTDDLLDQISCLKKLSHQSIKSYFSEAKSLFFALNKVGDFISESELLDNIVDGLDPAYDKFVKYYHFRQPSLSLDMLFSYLQDEESKSLKPTNESISSACSSLEQLETPFSSSTSSSSMVLNEVEKSFTLPNMRNDSGQESPVPPHDPLFISTCPSLTKDVMSKSPINDFQVLKTFSLSSSSHPGFLLSSNDECYLAVPIGCKVSTSQLLSLFFTSNDPKSYLVAFNQSFLPNFDINKSCFGGDKGSCGVSSALLDLSFLVYSIHLKLPNDDSFCLPHTIVFRNISYPCWFDAFLLYWKFLYNIHWRLFVISIDHGIVIQLRRGLWGRRCKFKLKLRCATFRLRGRIRPYTNIA